MKEFIVNENTDLRKFTDNTYPQGSLYLARLWKRRDVRVNGKKCDHNVPLRAGDRVTYYTTAAEEGKSLYTILYEDDRILVADKDSGVNAEAVYASLRERGEVYFIHRLDRNTQGLMLFAKTADAEHELLEAFRARKIEKYYEALCFGKFDKDHAIVTAYLEKDAAAARVRISSDPAHGEKIVTEYRVLARYPRFSKVEICLHTGKTHQIRAHLAWLGCPVVGDEKYGDSQKNRALSKTRQCLIAKRLVLHVGGTLADLDQRVFESSFCLES